MKIRRRNKMTLKDKVVLITGASSGLGAEIARKLADQGSKLVITARSSEKLQKVAAELQKRQTFKW
jgi:NADP-dependent 3-hydroxy acid dehydrogenase YdfG